MWIPLTVLAVLSIVGGLIGIPKALGGSNQFEHFLEPVIAQVHKADQTHEAPPATAVETAVAAHPAEEAHDTSTELGLTGLSVLLGFVGIGIGFGIFYRNPLRKMPAILENKYKVDEFYEAAVIGPIEHTSRDLLWKFVDVKIIDGFVNGVARMFAGLANLLRYTQTGYARNYAAVILLGAIIVIGYFGYIATR